MNTTQYFLSLSQELRGLQNRVRNFIEDAHWQTDGEWKESVLRYFLRRNLPRNVEVGRGFVISPDGCSSQIDVLIYDSSKPVLFRDGDLVFVTPDAVCGIIEVKSSVDNASFATAVKRLTQNISFICTRSRSDKLFGIFAFESSVTTNAALDILHESANGSRNVTDLVCLGDSHFIRWWHQNPEDHRKTIKKWHSYRPKQFAPRYFLHNVVEFINHESVEENVDLWFPPDGKEQHKDGEKTL